MPIAAYDSGFQIAETPNVIETGGSIVRLILPTTNSVIFSSCASTASNYLHITTGTYTGTGIITGTYTGTGIITGAVNSVIIPSGAIVLTNRTVTGTFSSCCNNVYTSYVNINGWACTPDGLGIVKKYKKQIVPKRTKSSIKRALKLMFNMGFEEEARIFLNGDSIEVSHLDSEFKFVITKYDNSLIYRTEHPGCSTPYKLELYTKTNVFIAELCVYMNETPVLDQVLGLALFIKSGDESKILRRANWHSLSNNMELREQLAKSYPDLISKLRLNSRTRDYDECDNAGIFCTPESNQSSITINGASGIVYSTTDTISAQPN